MYTIARKLERPSGKIDVVRSDRFGDVMNGHDGRLYPRGSTSCLPGFSPPCTVHGDYYEDKRQRWGAATRYIAESTRGPLCA